MLMAPPTVLCMNGKKYIPVYGDVKYFFYTYLISLPVSPFFYVSVWIWVLVICFSTVFTCQTFWNVYQGICFPGFVCQMHTHLVERVFVDEACHNHEGVLLFNWLLERFLQSDRYNMSFTVLFCEHRCRQGFWMSAMPQALEEHRRT